LILFVTFCLVYLVRFKTYPQTKLKPNTNYTISGVISSEPLISDVSQTLKLGDFRIKTAKLPNYVIGDRLKISGRLEERVINRFYSKFWFIYPEIEVRPKKRNESYGAGDMWLNFLKIIASLRARCDDYFSRGLPSPQANLLSGILLGSKTSFSPQFYESLRQSGTLHIVVASGMNIVILAKIIFDFLIKKFKRNVTIFVIFFCILIYMALAGFDPPIVRAAIMAFLAFLAQFLGRAYWGGFGLFLAAGIMLLANPFLLFEVGFQLSVVATAGLIFVGPRVKGWIEGALQKFQQGQTLPTARSDPALAGRILNFFKNDFVETVSAQIAVLPILLSTFGQFNLLSIVPNVLIGFLVPGLMRYGLLYLLIAFVVFPLARLAGFFLWVPLSYMVEIIKLFGKIDWLVLRLSLPWWWAFLWWAGLWLVLAKNRGKAENGEREERICLIGPIDLIGQIRPI